MQFEVRHVFPLAPDEAWVALFSEPYELAVDTHNEVDREVLSDGPVGEERVRRLRFDTGTPLPALIAKAIGVDHLTYEVIETYPSGVHRMRWKVIPSAIADRVDAEGIYEILPHEGGCERIVRGDITVSLPLVGGRIEKLIGRELAGSYERGAEFAVEWLGAHWPVATT